MLQVRENGCNGNLNRCTTVHVAELTKNKIYEDICQFNLQKSAEVAFTATTLDRIVEGRVYFGVIQTVDS